MLPKGFIDETKYSQEMIAKLNLVQSDPWEFVKIAKTKDEVDLSNPIKLFPRNLDYLYLYVRLWQKHRLLAVPKSRRMKMSWINIILFLWDTMFHSGRNNALVSKKEEDSHNLLERAKFVYDHLDFPRDLLPIMEFKYCHMLYPEIESGMHGYPSGADQLRQYTFSGIMGDEAGFWGNAQEMYKGSYPTIEGGGRMVLVSSAAPGFFKKLVFDQMDSEMRSTDHFIVPHRSEPMTGIEVWENKRNKFCIMQIHYTADPAKRSVEWLENMKASMPIKDWNQEYEIAWDSYDGLPVYSDFDKEFHCSKDELLPEIGLPLLRGWDFGLYPACIVAQLQGNTLVVLREFTGMNIGTDRFSDVVLNSWSQLYPSWYGHQVFDFVDPSGFNRSGVDERSHTEILSQKRINPIGGEQAWETRRKSVEHFLTYRDKDGPGFLMNRDLCPTLFKGFKGGYRYPDSVIEREPAKLRPLKDEHSHPHDSLQYIATRITQMKRPRLSTVPALSYSNNSIRRF